MFDPDDDAEEEEISSNWYDNIYISPENTLTDDDDEKDIRRYCKREWSDGA